MERLPYRVLPRDGTVVVAEVRVYSEGPPPAKGITARLLRDEVVIGKHVYGALPALLARARGDALEEPHRRMARTLFDAWVGSLGFTDTVAPAGHRGPKGRPLRDYAKLAKDYVDGCSAGGRSPVADLAAKRGMTPVGMRAALNRAREKGMLTRQRQGSAGGRLTPRAVALCGNGGSDEARHEGHGSRLPAGRRLVDRVLPRREEETGVLGLGEERRRLTFSRNATRRWGRVGQRARPRRCCSRSQGAHRRRLPVERAALGETPGQCWAHIGGFFGEKEKAITITAPRIAAYLTSRTDEGAAAATIKNELAALKRSFNLARKAGTLLPNEVPAAFPTIAPSKARAGFFEREEHEAVKAALPSDEADVAEYLFWSGWRKGEVLGPPMVERGREGQGDPYREHEERGAADAAIRRAAPARRADRGAATPSPTPSRRGATPSCRSSSTGTATRSVTFAAPGSPRASRQGSAPRRSRTTRGRW